MKIANFQIGSDIEWFVKRGEEIISAEGLIRGSKKEPYKFDPSNKYFATSLDNILAEGNIPPVKTAADFYHAINKLQNYIQENLPEDCILEARADARVNEKYLQTENAKTFGCDPSYIVWKRDVKDSPVAGNNLRTAGFHVHCSWDNADEETIEEWVKSMDLHLGLPSILLEPKNERRINYGLAGEFRFGQSYSGAEYRTLSSYFARSREDIEWVYNQTTKAIDFVNKGKTIDIESPLAKDIQLAINEQNKELAQKILKECQITY